MAEGKGAKILTGLVVMILITLVGLVMYRAFLGESTINFVVFIILAAFLAFGLLRWGLISQETTLSANTFISLVIVTATPIVLFILLPKLGFNFFSITDSVLGVSGNFSAEFDITGTAGEWVKNNIGWFITGLILLYIFRDKITRGVKSLV